MLAQTWAGVNPDNYFLISAMALSLALAAFLLVIGLFRSSYRSDSEKSLKRLQLIGHREGAKLLERRITSLSQLVLYCEESEQIMQ